MKENEKNQNQEQEKHVLQLIINNQHYKWHQEYIIGSEIRTLGEISAEDDIFLAIKKPWEDEPIMNDTKVNLARPEIEHFYSLEKPGDIVIIVNGTPKKWDKKKISFKELIILAYGNYIDSPTMVYAVAYEDGPKQNPEGSMIKDSIVFVKTNMIFHATATDKS